MIFTSYYGKMSKFPYNFVPVSISLWKPKWYDGAHYPILAPTKDILSTWRIHHDENEEYWEKWYTSQFKKQVLDKLNAEETIANLEWDSLNIDFIDVLNCEGHVWESESVHLVLLCYEKDGDFCHRKLVSDWLNERGIPCKEAAQEDFEKYGMTEEQWHGYEEEKNLEGGI